MLEPLRLTCPVCRAGFRGQTICSRCGADLSALMELAARAYVLRCRAERAMQNKDKDLAYRFVRKANTLHRTPEGEMLAFRIGQSEFTGDSSNPDPGLPEPH